MQLSSKAQLKIFKEKFLSPRTPRAPREKKERKMEFVKKMSRLQTR
jgi:hypothetical protein